jgi:two-component system nitrogen regulation response regulator GlnG
MEYLCELPWPGNVRQLENTCRWIAVMATTQEVMIEDLPPELLQETPNQNTGGIDWERALRSWTSGRLSALKPGDTGILYDALPRFERIMIQEALKQTGGRKREASKLLGWGRNTLTRKISDLGMADEKPED